MFIAHAPAGYLLTRALLGLPGARQLAAETRRRIVSSGCLEAMAPDLDMLWWLWRVVVDGRRLHHHDFVPHWALF